MRLHTNEDAAKAMLISMDPIEKEIGSQWVLGNEDRKMSIEENHFLTFENYRRHLYYNGWQDELNQSDLFE